VANRPPGGAARRRPRGWFVTGTDTGVGKSVLTAALVAALRAEGIAVQARKPILTGLDEPADPDWPHDHELLARVLGTAPEEVALRAYGPAVSPHLAAELSASPVLAEELLQTLIDAADGDQLLIVEGVGGLLVPLDDRYDVRALARALGLPLLIAARPGLGTINHTLLTIEAARAADLEITAVVLTPWPEEPDAIERSNRQTIARLGEVAVWTLPRVARGDSALLAAAGRTLPLAGVPSWECSPGFSAR